MSREIKFRVWDKTSDSMLYQDDFERVELDTKNKMVTLIAEEESDKSHYVLDYEDSIEAEILQYTGLKDKNGKEIYEGDILGRHEYWPIRIEYDKGCFMVRDLDKVRYNNLILNVPICNFESINDWKVIGNIYENPELLEGER